MVAPSYIAFVPTFTGNASATSISWSRSLGSTKLNAIYPQRSRTAPISRRNGKQTPSMLFDFVNLPFQRVDTVNLPQRDTRNASKRAKAVATGRSRYLWTQSAIGGASLIKGLPKGETPSLGWLEQLVQVVIRVAVNTALNKADQTVDAVESTVTSTIAYLLKTFVSKIINASFDQDDAEILFDALSQLLSSHVEGVGKTLEDYKELYKNIKLDAVTQDNQFFRDDIFGWYRVAGPNPMRLVRLKQPVSGIFPELDDKVTKGIPSFERDSLRELQRDGRLYIISYPEFDGIETGKDQSGNTKPNFLYAPTCLLGVPKNPSMRETVLPLAIRCGQNSSLFPMYSANPAHTDAVTWLAAKLTVQVADAVIHETVYHLARTHLLVGIVVCATHRALPTQHPLYRLLKCHFYGTAFINNAAVSRLINPGGIIDDITAPDIFTTQGVAADGINGAASKFNEWFPDVDLVSRDVMDPSLRFPYRDDALLVWDAILQWVTEFIGAYYHSDKDVLEDKELAAWCDELTAKDKGNLHGFGDLNDGKIKSVNYLTRAVAFIIFTATAQHAAVNFPQGTMMQFAPSMPLAGYAPPPTVARPYADIDAMVEDLMPTLDRAQKQLTTAELIGVMQYGVLADYGQSLHFAPDQVLDAMQKLQARLGVIGGMIRRRNEQELAVNLPEYKHLVPSNIPQSINI